jgi:hypothetical protein
VSRTEFFPADLNVVFVRVVSLIFWFPISVYPDPRSGDAVVDFKCQKPSNTVKPIYRFKGKSGIFVLGDSNITGCRLTSPENCYMAKFQGGELVDLPYPAVDCSFLFQDSGFPYDVLVHAVSGWAIAQGSNTFDYQYFKDILAPFREEAAKDKDGRSLRAIVVIGGTNDVLACLHSTREPPMTVDAVIAACEAWLEGLAKAVGVPVFYAGAGSAKNMRYDMEQQDFPLVGPNGKMTLTAKRRLLAKAHALMFNRLGQKSERGSWGRMKNQLYHIQKPRLSTRFCDWYGHPGKCELYLQGLLLHNVLAWGCVKAGWQKDLKREFRLVAGFSCFNVSCFVFY